MFSLIGRMPAYGPSFALFLLSGVATLTLFTAGSGLVSGAVYGLRSSTRLAVIGLFHEAVARTLFNLIVTVIYSAVLLFAIGALQRIDAAPHHVERVAAGFFWTALMGFGVGLLRGYATLFAPVFERLYAILSRVLLFVSGVFYMPSFMPPQLREWLVLNPVLHGVELVRLGLYDQYPTIVYAPDYLRGFALGVTLLGVTLLWRRRAEVMG